MCFTLLQPSPNPLSLLQYIGGCRNVIMQQPRRKVQTWMAFLRAKLGVSSKWRRRMPVTGQVRFPWPSQRSTHTLSYVCPVATMTGSAINSWIRAGSPYGKLPSKQYSDNSNSGKAGLRHLYYRSQEGTSTDKDMAPTTIALSNGMPDILCLLSANMLVQSKCCSMGTE